MKRRANLAWSVVFVLVVQIVLRSSVPVAATSSSPAVAVQPALGWSDLSITAPDDTLSSFALPTHFPISVSQATDSRSLIPIGLLPYAELTEGNAVLEGSSADCDVSDARGVHQYFVPFDDIDLWALFEAKASCHGADNLACAPLVSKVFVTAGSDGTVYYYDHWEDGYDSLPWDSGPTTVSGTLNAGATEVFESDILVAQVGTGPPYYYDGRDRITILGEDANVVRLANADSFVTNGLCPGPSGTDGWLAAAWEVLEVADWGTEYDATVGEDLNPIAIDDHDYAGLEIMASQDDTTVYYTDTMRVLDAGETYFVPGEGDGPGGGGVDSSDDITATAPIQVQMMTGACSTLPLEYVSAHGYTLQPRRSWGHAYWAPVPGFLEDCNPDSQDVDTDIYLHNPDTANYITVTVNSGDRLPVTLVITPNTTVSVLKNADWPYTDLAEGNQGTYMSSSGVFWGVVAVDSATSGATAADDWDWGYSLIPESELSSQVVVGYAPGNPEGSSLNDNGNVAFVVATTDDTRIYVDLDRDGLPDPFDMDGDGLLNTIGAWGVTGWDEPVSDQGILVQAGQVLRVGDPNDYNLMGARIYTTELGKHIAAAWGQDPCRATWLVYEDLGYTVLPLAVPRLSKVDDLATDADSSGDFSPGDTITYTLVLRNNGMGTMNNLVLTDSLPYTYTDFVVGSLQVTTPPPIDTVEYYDGLSWGTTPVSAAHMLRITWPYLEPQQTVTITFRAFIRTAIPVTITEICNHSVASSANTDPVTAEICACERPPSVTDLRIAKVDHEDPVTPGTRLVYTLTYANIGPLDAENVVVSDTLPPEVSLVEASPDQTSGPDPLVWNLGTLGVDESGTIVVTVTVQSWVTQTFTNTVIIATDTPETDYTNNEDREPTAVTVAPQTDLAIDKSDDPDPGVPGGPLAYALVYTNEGPFDAQEVYITDELPSGVTYGGVVEQPAGWTDPPSCDPGPPAMLTWYTPTLAAGAAGQIVYTVTAASDVPGVIVNRVCISTTTPETDYDNNCDVEPTPVQLLYFRVTPLPGAVLLEWETAWEIGTYGFYLLRSSSGDLDDAEEIAFVSAAGHGGGGGAAYSYRDSDVEAGGIYTYWLVDVDTSGERTVHSPVTVAALSGPFHHIYLPLVWRSL